MSETMPALLAALVTATPEIAALIDPEGEVSWLNPAFVTRWPCAQAPTVEGLLDVVDPADHATVQEAWEEVRSGRTRTAVRNARLGCTHTRRDGRIRLTRVTAGAAAGSVVIHIEQIDGVTLAPAGIDPLTGLADRAGLLAQLDAALGCGTDGNLALFDLDHFHVVNQSLGHATGDDVLCAVARRIQAATHDGDVAARVSGDKFAVLCVHADGFEPLVDAIRVELHRPVALGETQHVLDCSVGRVHLGLVAGTIEALAAAESAVHLAKARGRGRIETFDAHLRDMALTTLRRTSELQDAAERNEFVLRYQPIVDLVSGATLGCEALLRWTHPDLGEIGPAEFLDVAEASGIIHDLTGRLVDDACAAAAALSSTGRKVHVTLNLSPRQLAHPNLVELIAASVRRAGIDASQLMVEITETTVLVDVEAAVSVLTQLRSLGVLVALDDFGTGFSSLLRLRELPVDCVKIDRTFVSGIARNGDDLAIVASVINMATSLGLSCVAEGVESEDQVQQLRRLGCTTAQGFLWSPAVPLSEVPLRPAVRRVEQPQPTPAVDTATEAWIMRLHHSGASLHSIAAVLNTSGARTRRGTRWHPRSVAQVVSRSAFPELR